MQIQTTHLQKITLGSGIKITSSNTKEQPLHSNINYKKPVELMGTFQEGHWFI